MRFVMAHHADEGEAFAPDAFAHWIGRRIPINAGEHWDVGRLLAVKVQPDGRSAYLTVEVEDGTFIAGLVHAGYQPGTFGRGGEVRPAVPGGASGTDGHQGSSDSW